MLSYTHIEMPEELGQLAFEERKAQGLSQTALAQRSGTSQRFVSEFERGKQSVDLGKALRILHALGLKVAVGNVRTPQQSRELVQEGVARVRDSLTAEPAPKRKLADYLRERNG